MAKTLTKICLKSISLNLYLNYKICENNGFKIPESVGDKIFEYVNVSRNKIEIHDSKIFQKSIMDISKFYCGKCIDGYEFNTTCFISYDFLNNHRLEEFSIRKLENFTVYSLFFRVFTKKLQIEHVQKFMDSNDEEIESFFKDSFHVEESISLVGVKDKKESFRQKGAETVKAAEIESEIR